MEENNTNQTAPNTQGQAAPENSSPDVQETPATSTAQPVGSSPEPIKITPAATTESATAQTSANQAASADATPASSVEPTVQVQPVESTAQPSDSYAAAYATADTSAVNTAPVSDATAAPATDTTPAPTAQAAPSGTPAPAPTAAPYAAAPAAAPAQSNGKATGALVCGILAILFCGIPIIGIILGVVAIVLATSYLKGGGIAGTAKGGRICGIVGIVLSVIMIIVGTVLSISLLNAYNRGDMDVVINEIQESATTPRASSSSSASAAATAKSYTPEEQAALDAGTAALDLLVKADAQTVSNIAKLVDDSLLESDGYTLEDIGVNPEDYVCAMLRGATYDNADVLLVSGSSEASFSATLRMKDVIDVMDDYYDDDYFGHHHNSIHHGGSAYQAAGQELMDAVNDADMEDASIYLTLNKEGGKWVVSPEDWDAEMDILFTL